MRFLSLGTAWLLATAAAAQKCYWTDGNIAMDEVDDTEYGLYEPCPKNETAFSQCCALLDGEKCLPNGLCSIPDYYDYHPPCANEDWDNCVNPCPDFDPDVVIEVLSCTAGEYCCRDRNADELHDCCNDEDEERFELKEPDPAEEDDDENDGGIVDDNDNNNDNNNSGLSTSTIGAIAGSIGGAAVIGIIVAAWWCMRRRKKKNAKSTSNVVAYNNGDGGTGYHPVEQKPELDGGQYYAHGSPPGWSPNDPTMVGSTPQKQTFIAEMAAPVHSKNSGPGGLHEMG